MKVKLSGLLSAGAVLVAGLVASAPAAAQGTWNLGTGTGANCNPATSPIATVTCTAGSVSATMTAWGYFGSNTWTQGNLGDFDASGFGVYTGRYENSTGGGTTPISGQHAFDSYTSGCGTSIVSGNSGLSSSNSGCGGSIEGMLISFNTKVDMSQVRIGWSSGDADLAVYRWEGANSGPNMGTQAVSASGEGNQGGLTGWKLIGAQDMDLSGANPYSPTAPDAYSSYFLITTYFGTSTANNLNAGDDRFKLSNFTVGVCAGTLTGGYGGNGGNGATCSPGTSVPEPGSLALAAMALGGLAGFGSIRRRRLQLRA